MVIGCSRWVDYDQGLSVIFLQSVKIVNKGNNFLANGSTEAHRQFFILEVCRKAI